MLPTYIVAPDGPGNYALSGPLLPWPLRFRDETHAVSHGHHMCRSTGGRIIVLDSRGNLVISEHAHAHADGLRLLNDYRVTAR